MTLPEFFTTLLTELAWNLAVWLPTALVSLLFIRAVLGVRMRELIVEIEEHQTAAIGAVFFWVSLGFSLLLSRTIADPVAAGGGTWAEAFAWLALAVLVTMLLFALGVFLVFGTLARRRKESLLGYIRREMRHEHNLALSFIMGALFLVPVVVTYHLTLSS
ncbi:hypothetical protein DEDE109153_17145 [Deinococcus deserti]|uniref:Uncharacterized protein n=1 Tax=Deinococcus deserti (strain DSM 17065 / CIP 109153 / LMG 22923 / VCD115) TaxID=546414 RepID=C1D1W5_DEIDV|nr:hypothetical protein [Deinococcus deserti]ACO47404.1 Hypothetical protein; putative membrane protein [Deinococcus deserti VCD115]